MPERLRIAFLGLSITSSWGNGHASTYRALTKGLVGLGHRVTFLERDVPWYAGDNRDLPCPPHGSIHLYRDLDELRERHHALIREADVVVLGSYVPDGIAVGRWLFDTARGRTAFYDIDTPVTLASLRRGDCSYLAAEQIPEFDIYFSFSGGPLLDRVRREFNAQTAAPLYCGVDADLYYPEARPASWDLGYLGTYSDDRQPALTALLLEPARRLAASRFIVAGPQYPPDIDWPANVERLEHLPPGRHREFYTGQRFTLNVTRADMVRDGWSPSVRLFEAAACGIPIISDVWEGLETLFQPGEELLLARSSQEVLEYLSGIAEEQRRAIGARARARVLAQHTGHHRAWQFITAINQLAPAASASPAHSRRESTPAGAFGAS
jgi:spore maturation protein CgeB